MRIVYAAPCRLNLSTAPPIVDTIFYIILNNIVKLTTSIFPWKIFDRFTSIAALFRVVILKFVLWYLPRPPSTTTVIGIASDGVRVLSSAVTTRYYYLLII